jgi:hypothetical protein
MRAILRVLLLARTPRIRVGAKNLTFRAEVASV